MMPRASPLRAVIFAHIHQLTGKGKLGDFDIRPSRNQLSQLSLAFGNQVRAIAE